MKVIFPLLPVVSIYFLLLFIRGRTRRRLGLIVALSLTSVASGAALGLLSVGVLYAILFCAVGFFPIALRNQIRRAIDQFKGEESHFRVEIARAREECVKWEDQKEKLLEEVERISKRYEFARTLVARMEEKPVLQDLSGIFGSQKMVLGLAFAGRTPSKKEKQTGWNPVFTSGWVTEEEWKRILRRYPLDLDTARAASLPQSELPHKENQRELSLVSVPVKWGGGVQDLLAFLVEGALPKDFLDEVSVYAQLLGLGLHKTYLYKMVVEHSRRDGLTNLYLRGVFLERLNEEISFSKRYGTSFSVMILDLDHFKGINDTHGHLIGDKVLKNFADCLRGVLHPGVTLARYGGEEFAVLVGLAPAGEVMQTAERIRAAIEHLVLAVSDDINLRTVRIGKRKGEIRMTVSIGVAHYLPDAPPPEELIRRADVALYWAKEGGRNCVREWKDVK